LRRAASGERRAVLTSTGEQLTADDGTEVEPVWILELGLASRGHRWTSWEVPGLGVARPNLVLIEGAPQDPQAIFYLTKPSDVLPDVEAVPAEQWAVTTLYASPETQLPAGVEDVPELPPGTVPGPVVSVVDVVDIEPTLLASTTPGQLLTVPKHLRQKVLRRWLDPDKPVVDGSTDHRLAQIHAHAPAIAENMLYLAEMTPVGPDLYRCRTVGANAREFLVGVYLESLEPSVAAHDTWIRTSDVPCVLIAVARHLPISTPAKRLDSSAKEAIEADLTEIVLSQRLSLVVHAFTFVADPTLADTSELTNRRLAQATEAAAEARDDSELPRAVDAALELTRAALVAPQDTDELQQVSRSVQDALRELSTGANDLRRNDDPARAATRVSALQRALVEANWAAERERGVSHAGRGRGCGGVAAALGQRQADPGTAQQGPTAAEGHAPSDGRPKLPAGRRAKVR